MGSVKKRKAESTETKHSHAESSNVFFDDVFGVTKKEDKKEGEGEAKKAKVEKDAKKKGTLLFSDLLFLKKGFFCILSLNNATYSVSDAEETHSVVSVDSTSTIAPEEAEEVEDDAEEDDDVKDDEDYGKWFSLSLELAK